MPSSQICNSPLRKFDQVKNIVNITHFKCNSILCRTPLDSYISKTMAKERRKDSDHNVERPFSIVLI